MQTIGITGGIGSGKTTVCKVFYALGIPIYSADDRAKHLINTLPAIQQDITELLGEGAYNSAGYNRQYVASLIFDDPSLLSAINQIIHPWVAKDFSSWKLQQDSAPYLIREAAILFESGTYHDTLANIVVDAPLELRIRRVEMRDGFTRETIIKRVNNQWPADKLRTLADWVIENDDKKLILPQILNIHYQIVQKISVA